MPHFTLQLDPSGAGPVLLAMVGVSAPRAAALVAAKQAVPQGVTIRALVDTGASNTCIETSVLKALGLTPRGQIPCHTPSTGAAPAQKDVYDVGLAIFAGDASQPPLAFPTLAVMDTELFAAQGIHALIGRDVLAMCVLHYNGVLRQFTLAY
jgi:hypothetical protein